MKINQILVIWFFFGGISKRFFQIKIIMQKEKCSGLVLVMKPLAFGLSLKDYISQKFNYFKFFFKKDEPEFKELINDFEGGSIDVRC